MKTKAVSRKGRVATAVEEPPKAEKKIRPASEAERYTARCAAIGSDLIVADKLGVAPLTIGRRKTDSVPIAKEAWLALSAIEQGLQPEGRDA